MLYRMLLLFAGHALCDYPLQGDFLAKGKNPNAPLPGTPWYQCMVAHSLIHAGAVLVITRSVWFALAELVIHFSTDYAKCSGWFGPAFKQEVMKPPTYTGHQAFNIDQAIHYACKVLWAVL